MPMAATASTICFMILVWLGLLQRSFARDPNGSTEPGHGLADSPVHSVHLQNETASNLICTPFGACEPCPSDALNQPFCRPFGNRRLVHCVNKTEAHTEPSHSPHSTDSHTDSHPNTHRSEPSPLLTHESSQQSAGEVLAWESCGRIVPKERADFYEFVACNVAFAIVSLGILFFRSRRIEVMQARQLAARIGLFREERRGARV